MRNIIRFIIKYNIVFLFLFFETISFALLVNYNQYHKEVFANSSSTIVAGIMKISGNFSDYFRLKKANEELSRENALLRTQLESNRLTTDTSYSEITDSVSGYHYIYRQAKVVNNMVNKLQNYITINKGEKHGIKPGMGVITARGLAGVVRHTSANYATVVSILNTKLKVSAKLRETNHFGSLEWDGKSPEYVYLNDIPSHAPVHVGDAVVTSGFSAIFPDNILIGVIEGYKLNEGEGFYVIKVKLSTDFRNLTYVEVVEKPDKEELLELENMTYDD